MASPIQWACFQNYFPGVSRLSYVPRVIHNSHRVTSFEKCQGLPSVRRLTLRTPPTSNSVSKPRGFHLLLLRHKKPPIKKWMGLAAGDQTRGLDKINPARDHCATAREGNITTIKLLENTQRNLPSQFL